MEIYLLRHGIAEDAGPGRSDAERSLTGEGRDKLRRVLKRAQRAGVKPETILASPLKRAIETAELAAEVLGASGKIVRTEALLPEAPPAGVWEELRARQGEDSILLAGHEPQMSSLAAFLLACPALQVEFKKGALVRIDCDRFGREPRGNLRWMLIPAVAGE